MNREPKRSPINRNISPHESTGCKFNSLNNPLCRDINNTEFRRAVKLYHQQKIEYDIYIKGCVRSITKYYILQHELTTAMQCQLKTLRKF